MEQLFLASDHDVEGGAAHTACGSGRPEVFGDAADVAYYYGGQCGAGAAHSADLHCGKQEDPEFLCLFRH